jgi:hypothetical protein
MFFLLGHDVGRPLFGARYYGGTNEVRHLAYHCCFFRHRIQCFFLSGTAANLWRRRQSLRVGFLPHSSDGASLYVDFA